MDGEVVGGTRGRVPLVRNSLSSMVDDRKGAKRARLRAWRNFL